jgi:hypothetical protein
MDIYMSILTPIHIESTLYILILQKELVRND